MSQWARNNPERYEAGEDWLDAHADLADMRERLHPEAGKSLAAFMDKNPVGTKGLICSCGFCFVPTGKTECPGCGKELDS